MIVVRIIMIEYDIKRSNDSDGSDDDNFYKKNNNNDNKSKNIKTKKNIITIIQKII